MGVLEWLAQVMVWVAFATVTTIAVRRLLSGQPGIPPWPSSWSSP